MASNGEETQLPSSFPIAGEEDLRLSAQAGAPSLRHAVTQKRSTYRHAFMLVNSTQSHGLHDCQLAGALNRYKGHSARRSFLTLVRCTRRLTCLTGLSTSHFRNQATMPSERHIEVSSAVDEPDAASAPIVDASTLVWSRRHAPSQISVRMHRFRAKQIVVRPQHR